MYIEKNDALLHKIYDKAIQLVKDEHEGFRLSLEITALEGVSSYEIEVNDKDIHIKALDEASAFYGLVEVLKSTTPQSVQHSTHVAERGLHVDMGRKFYSLNWFKSVIEKMAEFKLNMLQMHVSENLGFRFESKKFPDIVSEEHLTQDEIKEIIAYAKQYYIDVIPSFDSPGHLEKVLSHYPEYQLEGNKTGLDITNMEARKFIKDIYDEILDVFSDAKIIHMGGDEFINFAEYDKYPQLEAYAQKHFAEHAKGSDTYIDFINDVSSYLQAKGLEVRVWNDGLYRLDQNEIVELNKDVVITYWTSWEKNMAPLSRFVEKGHRVVNYNDSFLYYVLGECAGYKYPTYEKIADGFDFSVFPYRNQQVEGETLQKLDVKDPQYIGGFFSIWSDEPKAQTEQEVFDKFIPALQAFANKAW
ncbi:MAG TPA: family 20 glycosylhydrolase [Erysipelothrix sp.]